MVSTLDRARAVASDPRFGEWLEQPGRGTELVSLIRSLIFRVDLLTGEAEEYMELLRSNATVIGTLRDNGRDQLHQIDVLAEAVAKVLDLHRDSKDSTCSSCRIPYPCDTARAARAPGTSQA